MNKKRKKRRIRIDRLMIVAAVMILLCAGIYFLFDTLYKSGILFYLRENYNAYDPTNSEKQIVGDYYMHHEYTDENKVNDNRSIEEILEGIQGVDDLTPEGKEMLERYLNSTYFKQEDLQGFVDGFPHYSSEK